MWRNMLVSAAAMHLAAKLGDAAKLWDESYSEGLEPTEVSKPVQKWAVFELHK